VIEDGAVVHESVILSGATVGGGAVVSGSVIGPGARVAPRRQVVRELVAGEAAAVRRGWTRTEALAG
jgi:NDP-sugar pyrophosphorylase family protein